MPETVEARVLLVSSNPEQVRQHADRLSGVGFVVRACGPDANGFSLFDQFDPQVTVVDVSSADAFEFLERGRRSYPACGFLSWKQRSSPPPSSNGRGHESALEAEPTTAALSDFMGSMKVAGMRFWSVEHWFGMVIGIAWPRHAARVSAAAGAIAWAALLVVALLRGSAIGTLATTLGGAMGVPGVVLFLATLLYPAILAASAAWLAHLVSWRRSDSTGSAAIAREPSHS